MHRLRGKLTYANVISTLCLILLIGGGTAYAATTMVPKNSVGAKQIKKNSITSAKVKNGSLLSADFGAGQIPAGPSGSKGDTGAKGDTGPKGDTGAEGAPGVSGYQQVDAFSEYDSTSPKSVTASCPVGKTIIGGGAFLNSFGAPIATTTSVPLANGKGWSVTGYETSPTALEWNIDARAICAVVTP